MSVSINGTGGITFADASTQSTGGYTGFRNRIINGAMMIDQRNAGASVTIPATSVTYTLDRWMAYGAQASKFSVQQNAGSVTPPVGFTNYLGVTSLSAYSVGAAEQFILRQTVEGFNVADLAWGTANAKTITLSFQVYSSLTGTFGGVIRNSADNRSYPFSYTVSSTNTWTSISITIAGDTSGTWVTNNGTGLKLQFGLGCGSSVSGTAGTWASATYESATGATSVVGTNGATFYITGVQLEKGSTATSFDYRPYGTELALCQRYYYRMQPLTANSIIFGSGYADSTTRAITNHSLPVVMRTSPTAGYSAASTFSFAVPSGNPICTSVSVFRASPYQISTSFICSGGGFTAGWGLLSGDAGTTSTYIDASAEL